MIIKFSVDLIITLAVFVTGFILVDGIFSHLYLFLDFDIIDGYLWNDLGTMISSTFMFFLVLLYYGYINEKSVESIQNDFEKMGEVIEKFSHEKPNSDFPMVTDLNVYPMGDQFVCNFRIYLTETKFILNEVVENSEDECYNVSMNLIKDTIVNGDSIL